MDTIQVGDQAPDITGIDQHGNEVGLRDFRDRQAVVLFFYPADNSPICTKEACTFRDAYEAFADEGAVVIGVSGDSVESHQGFAESHRLPFILLADVDGSIRQAFGVPKSLVLLPGRVTYVIDRQGVVRHVFSAQFSAGRHVAEALEMVRKLEGATHDE